uniref:Uncharacterized protein n=1 Tax=Rousettus aegyptiacus TaxID=9407 RepID=A0A7J8D6Z2_ROUAE|nr:hypothetical protein HJG63_008744 [Rousettus aegyptiacus]
MECQEAVFLTVTDTVSMSGLNVAALHVGPIHSKAIQIRFSYLQSLTFVFSPELFRKFMIGFGLAKLSLMMMVVGIKSDYSEEAISLLHNQGVNIFSLEAVDCLVQLILLGLGKGIRQRDG